MSSAHDRAVGREGAEDVTSVYVDDWENCLDRRRRKGWDEGFLQRVRQVFIVHVAPS